MSLTQFRNSLASILANPHINRRRGVAKHLHWQYRKALNLFPFEQTLSTSRIIAHHKRCGVSALIYSQGLYDYNNMNLLRMLLREGGVFFDVGANIGSYALVASESKAALVFAFEPHPRTFEFLKTNVELNHRSNVRLFNVALGAEPSRVLFTNEEGGATNHIEAIGTPGAISVPCARAESVCAGYDVAPTIAKIDVEGFEYDVLAGFGGYLKSLDMVMIETNGLSDARSKGQEEIQRLLRRNGFHGPFSCDFDSRTLSRRRFSVEDSLYCSESFLETIVQTGLTLEDSA